MPFALSHHRRPQTAHSPSVAATVLYMVTMFLLLAVVESACVPMVSHASIHQGEGLAWIVLAVAAYRLGSRYRYPNGAFLFGMASAVVFQQRYVFSMPIRRAVRCGDMPPDIGGTLLTWFALSLLIGLGARLLASAAMDDQLASVSAMNTDLEHKTSHASTATGIDLSNDRLC